MTANLDGVPKRAIWRCNCQDPAFGRIYVEMQEKDGSTHVAVSRIIFADSFVAARDALSKHHDAETTFREGEIMVLMSMNPFGRSSGRNDEIKELLKEIPEENRLKIERVVQQLEEAENNTDLSKAERESKQIQLSVEFQRLLIESLDKLEPAKANKYIERVSKAARTRDIVLHPSVQQRLLAWALARVDFGFNRIDELLQQAKKLSGDASPSGFFARNAITGAHTWQFFELNCVIEETPFQEGVTNLRVESRPLEDSKLKIANPDRSHFAVSMFGPEPETERGTIRVEDELYRLKNAELKLQPFLDWFATRHDDFMRLNDFSEAFSILRWVIQKGAAVGDVSNSALNDSVPSPDRVVLDKGPEIAPILAEEPEEKDAKKEDPK